MRYTPSMHTNIQYHEDAFAAYTQPFLDAEQAQRGILELKIAHTQRVVQHMRSLISQEPCLAPHARTCLLAALYHDVARFPQFARWRTFRDSRSVNHGLLGVKVLKEQGWLQREEAHVRHAVLASVGMHNRFCVPQGIAQPLRLICTAVRDADKLDIFRVMVAHFNGDKDADPAVVFYAKDEPHAWSPLIVKAVLENRLASYNDIVYINDFKILLCSWFHDLHFKTTRKTLASAGYLQNLMKHIDDCIGDSPEIAHLLRHMSTLLETENAAYALEQV